MKPISPFKRIARIVFCCFAVLAAFQQTAHAYIDPGSGSYFFQILIAGFLGGLYAVKLFWNSILSFFKKIFRPK